MVCGCCQWNMPTTLRSNLSGYHVRLVASRAPLARRTLKGSPCSGGAIRTHKLLAALNRPPDCRPAAYQILARHSDECLGYGLTVGAADPGGEALLVVCGSSLTKTIPSILLDAAFVAMNLLFEDGWTETVEVKLLGADRDLCRRMREFGFHPVPRPRTVVWFDFAAAEREAAFRLGRHEAQSAWARYDDSLETPAAWLWVPPHPLPA